VISCDTSVFIDFLRGGYDLHVQKLKESLHTKTLLMNPFVLAELLSSPRLSEKKAQALVQLPIMFLQDFFFERAGLLRKKIYAAGHGIGLIDVFIAQVCIDAEVPLLTKDLDFTIICQFSSLKSLILTED